MNKEFWDFDEHKNYKTININGNNFKVIYKYRNYYDAAIILNEIHKIIVEICLYFKINYSNYSDNDKILIDCFIDIHPTRYLLSEMQLKTDFYGLNKPKSLYISTKPSIGKDKKWRASYRHVFITLRDSNGNFNNMNTIMKLVIHEISHTMCNHVTWRDDDHGKDFVHAEKLITDAYKKII